MGKEKQEELTLRQVHIDTTEVTAVSEFMNTQSSSFIHTEDTNSAVYSPVMKKMTELSDIPATKPKEEEVIKAHEEVGLKLSPNSKKHPKRVSRAEEKREFQRKLVTKRTAWAAKKAQPDPNPLTDDQKKEQAYTLFMAQDMNLKSFMYDKGGKTPYETLLKKYDVLKTFLDQIPDYAAAVQDLINTSGNDPEKQEEIVNARARLKTLLDIRAYYDVYERLMLNKYYALLPHDEMHSLSYMELRRRLAALYDETGTDRNNELIDYYENLIRLKEIGLTDGKSATARETEYRNMISPKKEKVKKIDEKKEISNIADIYGKLKDRIAEDSTLLSANTAKVYQERFFKVYEKEIKAYKASGDTKDKKVKALLDDFTAYTNKTYENATDDSFDFMVKKKSEDADVIEKDDGAESGIILTDAQKEGYRKVCAALIKKGYSDGRFALVNNLLAAPIEQQMMVFYLVETGKEESSVPSDLYTALYNYQPNPELFLKKGKWKIISRAIRSSMGYTPLIKTLGAAEKSVRDADEADKTVQKNLKATNAAKIKGIADSIINRGKLLRLLYRSAGLHEDMPPDMAEDPVLRQRLIKEYKEIGNLVQRLKNLAPAENISKADFTGANPEGDTADAREDEESESFEKAEKFFDVVNEKVLGYGLDIVGEGFETGGGLIASITESNIFSFISGGAGGITALFGAVGVILGSISIATDDTISTADRWEQSLSVSADALDALGGAVTTVTTIGSAIMNMSETAAETASETVKWLGDTADVIWSSGNVLDKIGFAAGGVAVVTGALRTASSGVKIGRNISTHIDIHRSKKTLESKDQNSLTKDEKLLKKFLAHQQNETIRRDVSAAMGVVTGTMEVVAGALALTGYLAPVGAIVGLAAVGLEIGTKIATWSAKKYHRMDVVDDYIGMDSLVKEVLDNHPKADQLKEMHDVGNVRLRSKIREEALAMMGFSSYKECFRHICREYAALLYKKVFTERPVPPDREMYVNAMKSLGMKMKGLDGIGEPKPTIDAMTSKMMA